MMVIYDVYDVAHIVINEVEMTQTYERHRIVENWQVRVACEPDKRASNHLDLWGRHPDIARANISLGNPHLAIHPTCIACIGAR